jgi:hypothetical protein
MLARKLILTKDLTMTRDELDAGVRSDMRPMTFESIVAKIYNDPDIVY